MKVVIEEITGFPPYHLYKNARILRFIIKCDCGEEAREIYIFEDLEKQKTEELQKKLDIAVDALKSAHEYYQNCVIREKQPQEINWYCTAMNMDNDIFKALEEITAMEQKDK